MIASSDLKPGGLVVDGGEPNRDAQGRGDEKEKDGEGASPSAQAPEQQEPYQASDERHNERGNDVRRDSSLCRKN